MTMRESLMTAVKDLALRPQYGINKHTQFVWLVQVTLLSVTSAVKHCPHTTYSNICYSTRVHSFSHQR